jgi:hypothetical protein
MLVATVPGRKSQGSKQQKGAFKMSDAHVSATTERTSGLAIASLILSCLTVGLGPFGCIPGIICGHLGRAECRKNPTLRGDGLALAGLIIGYMFLVLGLLAAFLLFAFTASPDPGIVTLPAVDSPRLMAAEPGVTRRATGELENADPLENDEQPWAAEPLVVLSGSNSAVIQGECLRITSEEAWVNVWNRHAATQPKTASGLPVQPMPTVNFDACMVIAIFGGNTWNTAGLEVITTSQNENDEIVIGIDWCTYQSMGDGNKVTPFAFLVMSCSSKPLLLQYDTRGLGERAADLPPRWKLLQQFPALRD